MVIPYNEIAVKYVQVTAGDGSTWGSMLNGLWRKIDFSKITARSYLSKINGVQTIIFNSRVITNVAITCLDAAGGNANAISTDRVQISNGDSYYHATSITGSGAAATTDLSTTAIPAGIIFRFYY